MIVKHKNVQATFISHILHKFIKMDNDQLIQGKSMTPFHSQTKKQIIKLMKHQMDMILQ